MDLLFLRVAILSFFGVFISITDLRERKIYNRHLIVMALFGISFFLLTSGLENILNYGINFILCFLVGIGFWKVRFWHAGDGKLFAVCALYFPVKFYEAIFPAEIMLFNFFILAFLLWLPSLIYKTKSEDKIKAFKTAFKPVSILDIALTIFGLFWIIGEVVSLLGVSVYLFSLVIALLVYHILGKYFSKNMRYILILLAALRIVYDEPDFFSTTFMINYLLTLFVILSVYGMGILAMHISYDTKYLKDILVGDVPMGVMAESSSGKEIDFDRFLRDNFDDWERILVRGFNNGDVKRIGGLEDKIGGFIVKKYIPFAPLFFISLILTILLQSDIVTYLIGNLYTLVYE